MCEYETFDPTERAYMRDRRVTARFLEPPTDGTPFKWIVCDLCRGGGSVVNPSIDCNGLTAENFADDPDFRDDYLSGVYDILCPQCRGRRVVPQPPRQEEADHD